MKKNLCRISKLLSPIRHRLKFFETGLQVFFGEFILKMVFLKNFLSICDGDKSTMRRFQQVSNNWQASLITVAVI